MKVAYLIDSLGAGGSERSLAEMLPHLANCGVEARVFVLSEPALGFGHLVRTQGIEIEVLPSGWLGRRASLRQRLETWRPDLLHTTLFYSDVLGRLAAWRSGVPVLSSLVGVGYEPERFADPRIKRWRLRAVQLVDGWTGRHLNAHFHAVSQAAKDSAVARLGLAPESVTVVRRGRDLERFAAPAAAREAARERHRVGDDELLLVNVGRQTFHKAQLVLLEAVLRLVRSGRPVRLIVAGQEGPCTAELARFVELHQLQDRVELAGHLDDVPELLAAADIFAFPSRLEGLPGAVLEATAMGLPVVAADIPAVREIFPDGGDALLVSRDSVDELTEALDRLVSNEELRQELGRRSREIFLTRFNIREAVPKLVDLYRQVASTRAPSGAHPGVKGSSDG